MPNWVTNILEVSGTPENVAKVREKIICHVEEHDVTGWFGTQHIDEHDTVDFELLVPMPEILMGMTSGSCEIDGERVNHWVTEDGVNRKLNAEEQAALDTFGDWYSWACSNWGCKWNASRTDILEDTDETLCVKFETPWAMPYPWFIQLLMYFASVESPLYIQIDFADEDFGSNTGIAQYSSEDREVTFSIYEDQSVAAYDHAAEVIGYDPREEYPEEYKDLEYAEGHLKVMTVKIEDISVREPTEQLN